MPSDADGMNASTAPAAFAADVRFSMSVRGEASPFHDNGASHQGRTEPTGALRVAAYSGKSSRSPKPRGVGLSPPKPSTRSSKYMAKLTLLYPPSLHPSMPYST